AHAYLHAFPTRRSSDLETEKLPPDAYDPKVTAKVYDLLVDKARRVVAAGHSAVVDAVYADERERAAIRMVAAEAGSRFRGIYLEIGRAHVKQRVECSWR